MITNVFRRYNFNMKKAFLRLMVLVLGLNVFTACYGPAPYPYGEPESEATEQNETKAADEDECSGEKASDDLEVKA